MSDNEDYPEPSGYLDDDYDDTETNHGSEDEFRSNSLLEDDEDFFIDEPDKRFYVM